MLVTSVVGAIPLFPALWPSSGSIAHGVGAGVMQAAVFISTLMTVGMATAPLEAKYFGRKAVVWRNGLNVLPLL